MIFHSVIFFSGAHVVCLFMVFVCLFQEHALQELSDQSATKILNEDVRWVITVPAIWKMPAKQFMRTAAYQAGIASPDYPDQLLIALEPEAASIYCRKLRMHQLVPEKPVQTPLNTLRRGDTLEPVNMDRLSDEIRAGRHPPQNHGSVGFTKTMILLGSVKP